MSRTVGVLAWPSLDAQSNVHARATRRECSCEQVAPQDHEHPGEWVQNPLCPSHPDPLLLIAAIEEHAAGIVKVAAGTVKVTRGTVTMVVSPSPSARSSDPDTSHAAAASVDPFAARALHLRIVWLLMLTEEGMTHEQIANAYGVGRDPYRWPQVSPSGLRSRTAELHRAGVVLDTGDRRRMVTGRQGIVWDLAPEVRRSLPRPPAATWDSIEQVVNCHAARVAGQVALAERNVGDCPITDDDGNIIGIQIGLRSGE